MPRECRWAEAGPQRNCGETEVELKKRSTVTKSVGIIVSYPALSFLAPSKSREKIRHGAYAVIASDQLLARFGTMVSSSLFSFRLCLSLFCLYKRLCMSINKLYRSRETEVSTYRSRLLFLFAS
jgi:hypothetical protein